MARGERLAEFLVASGCPDTGWHLPGEALAKAGQARDYPAMRVYEGIRTDDGCMVTADGRPLDLRHDLRKHSPTGAEWGYGGSGPAQLALALLADALGEDLALRHYQLFKREIVAGFEQQGWILTQAEIRCWIAKVLSAREDQAE